jgi:hypothetical protein
MPLTICWLSCTGSCILYYCVKMFLQQQHVSTQLRRYHQAGIVMKLKMVIIFSHIIAYIHEETISIYLRINITLEFTIS